MIFHLPTSSPADDSSAVFPERLVILKLLIEIDSFSSVISCSLPEDFAAPLLFFCGKRIDAEKFAVYPFH